MRALLSQIAALAGPESPQVLADWGGCLVVRVGDRVVKTHDPDGGPEALAVRLAAAGSFALSDVLLAPLQVTAVEGYTVSIWPRGEPVDPDEPAAPWTDAGALLARLHSVRVSGLPPCAAPLRLERAIEAAAGLPGSEPVLAAYGGLPGVPAGSTLVHGDFHLGQMLHFPGLGWRLTDVDDLGLGNPAWDLGRPACWLACGLMPPEAFAEFIAAYRAGGGPALPPDGDPWPALDAAARAMTVQSGAQALARAAAAGRPLDEAEEAFVSACERLSQLGPGE